MPEIKNNFHKGIMNKDLDERIVPNGQYRDAMNIQVSTSESSQVGTVQNILGSDRVEQVVGIGYKCVGAIADEKNDVLYWFVTSDNTDAIIEYHDNGTVTPILVDDKTRLDSNNIPIPPVLKFDPDNIITGINIIDDLIFWTDNVNEPRRINVTELKKNNHGTLNNHSLMFVDYSTFPLAPITEDHITVIRKRPQKAPTVTFTEVSIQSPYYLYEPGVPTTGFSFYSLGEGDISGVTILPNGNTLGNITLHTLDTTSPYVDGDILLLLQNTSIGNLPQTYDIKIKVIASPTAITFGSLIIGWSIPFEIMEIGSQHTDVLDELLHFDVVKEVDIEPIFEKELIRFATRYKYTDSEYSAFSPFTQPVFFAGAFGFHPTKDPYNLAMENRAVSIRLQDLIPTDIPDDVVQLDILFKKERSTTVYSIDSIKENDPAPNYWQKNDYAEKTVLLSNYPVLGDTNPMYHSTQLYPYEYKGEYEITVENIYAAVPDNQMLRPWDNVPRKALAQEITANRVVYGNYLQNYTLKDVYGDVTKPLIIPGKENRDILGVQPSFVNSRGKKSVKSLRTYRLGIVYGDEYGRETPVFTSKDASINIPFDQDLTTTFNGSADKSLRLIAELQGNQPDWAYYFKYYIKQTTGEYYNLTMDRVYRASGDSNLWISFPSSDRNKIQEGDYFSIKKQVDLEQIIPVENNIKIIDIKNEAPETIKYDYISLGTGGGSATDLSAMFTNISAHPAEGVKRLYLDKEAWTDGEGGLALEDLSKSDRLAVQFAIVVGGNNIISEKYFVSGFSWEDDGTVEGSYNIVLRKTIQPHDSWVESSVGVLNSAQNLTMTVYKLEQKDATEFEGRFFVKIISSPVTQTYLVPSAQDVYNYVTLAKMKFFNLEGANGVVGSSNGIFNTINTLSNNVFPAVGNTNIRPENQWDDATSWDTANNIGSTQGWFIDSTMFVATQSSTDLNAEKSGRGYKGNLFDTVNQYINGLEGIVSPPVSGYPTTQNQQIQGGPYSTNASGDPQGPRHFSDEPINLSSGTYSQYSTNPQPNNYLGGNSYVNSPYRIVADGGHFIHLSFFAPGVDLHDGTFHELTNIIEDDWAYNNNNVENHCRDVFQLGLQQIRARSIYIDGSAANGNGWNSGQLEPSLAQGYWSFPTVPGNSSNHNNLGPTEMEEYENQWNPGYLNPGAQAVIDQLKAGSRFKIVDDTNDFTYTIKAPPRVIRFYNHTAWNPSPTWGSNGTQIVNWDVDNSVAVKLQNFFYSARNNGSIPNVSAIIGWQDLKDAIHNFGKANNRRVCYVLQVDNDPRQMSALSGNNFLQALPDNDTSAMIRFIDNYIEPGANTMPESPAIFETEAKEDVDLNIYYEASDALPIELDSNPDSLKGHLLGPVGNKVTCSLLNSSANYGPANVTNSTADFYTRVAGWEGDIVELNNPGLVSATATGSLIVDNNDYINQTLTFWREDSGYTTGKIQSIEQITGNYITKVKLDPISYNKKVGLSYYNCFSFGNGVESNRIRDDYNESYILNGVKASTVLEEPYEEERRKYGLIYSGIYNSTSGVNNLNQFIAAEKITKDIMPSYGSIQKLYARDKDLITLCEDKIIRVYVDKDMLYNADGNAQLLATNRVLGTAEPFRGNFGISKNPESFASESFRAYFTDKQRGAVIRLSMDGLTPISDAGMHDFFRDNLKTGERLYGSYDAHKGDYNLTIFKRKNKGKSTQSSARFGTTTTAAAGPQVFGCTDPLADNYNPSATHDDGSCVISPYSGKTISYNEASKGWTSFKSFIPEFGLSSVNQYYTMNLGQLWKHHVNQTRNTFYNQFTESSITPILNMQPTVIKHFNTLNYEGSESKIDEFRTRTTDDDGNTIPSITDNSYYNLYQKPGWYVEEIHTDKQEGSLNEFIEKEGKWFNYIKGKEKQAIDVAAFNFQGLGIIDESTPTEGWGCTDPLALNFDATAVFDDGSCVYLEPCQPCNDNQGEIPGCCDPLAHNYDPLATCTSHNFPCHYCLDCGEQGADQTLSGCCDDTMANYDPNVTCSDPASCIAVVYGCTDPLALNYYAGASADDGSCVYVPGCTDPLATNYDPLADFDDGSCTYVRGPRSLAPVRGTGGGSGGGGNQTTKY